VEVEACPDDVLWPTDEDDEDDVELRGAL